MAYDTPWRQERPAAQQTAEGVKALISHLLEEPAVQPPGKKRGRPQVLQMQHLALRVLWCVLQGWHAQLELWRFICRESIGRFAPVILSDQAVYKRLAQGGAEAMQALCVQVTACILQWLAPYEDLSLAPQFVQVLALDESKLDAMKRWISALRGLPNGDPALLAGRISVLFDLRRQCVRRLDLLWDASAHCCVHAPQMLSSVLAGSLLLFDLGYDGFEWVDELTARRIWWISRIKVNRSLVVQHVLVQIDGYSEQIVQLGAHRSDRAAFSLRLISIRSHGVWYRYLSNVLDPRQLSGAEVARLYARRWDIELAFRTLKDHLNLRLLWSAKPEVIAVQVWASLMLAQICSCYQVQVAAQAGVEVFDVSMDLLIRHLPRWLATGLDPVAEVLRTGRQLGIIRPSTRICRQIPYVPWHLYHWPPDDLPLVRVPRYDHRPAGNLNRKQKQST